MAFSKTESIIDVRINSAQSLDDREQDIEDCLTPQDMMSFSWQIAQGMVSENFSFKLRCLDYEEFLQNQDPTIALGLSKPQHSFWVLAYIATLLSFY